MAESTTIPELVCIHPDGSKRSRLEMDLWIRENCPKVHWLRIISSRTYGLAKQYTFDMKEIVLRHWLLDELVRRGHIHGDMVGVNPQTHNDETEARQFTQRLMVLVQNGQACQPKSEEGIDMTAFNAPPPPVLTPNGTPSSTAPATPAGPSFGPAPGAPTMLPSMSGPPQNFAPAPSPSGPAPSVPTPAASNRAQRRGSQRGANSEPPVAVPPASPVPPVEVPVTAPLMPPVPVVGVVAPMPVPTMNTPNIPLPNVSMPGAVSVAGNDKSIDFLKEKVSNLGDAVDKLMGGTAVSIDGIKELNRKIDQLSMAMTILSRAIYQKQGTADLEEWLKELGFTLPPR